MPKQKPLCVQFRLNGANGSEYRPIVVMVRLAGEKRYSTCKTGVYVVAQRWQPYLRQKLHPSIIREKTVEARLDAVNQLVQQLYKSQKQEKGLTTGKALVRSFKLLTKGTGGRRYA